MNFPILASVLIFILILRIFIKKNDKEMDKTLKSYLEKEQAANFVRKKSLENLPYITIPDSILNLPVLENDENFRDASRMLTHLKDQKIVNFTGISNTELKMEYGTANITVLTEYDQNYIHLVRTLQKLGESLVLGNRPEDAKMVFEFAVDSGSDIKTTYRALAQIYLEENNPAALENLITKALSLTTVNSGPILRSLNELKDTFPSVM